MNIFKNFPDLSIHLSSIMGIKIYKNDNTLIGTVRDLFVNYEEAYPSTLAIQFKNKSQVGYVTWHDVIEFSREKIIISDESSISFNQNFPKVQEKQTVTSVLAS